MSNPKSRLQAWLRQQIRILRADRPSDRLTGTGLRITDGSLTLRHLRVLMHDTRLWPDDSIIKTEPGGIYIEKGESR